MKYMRLLDTSERRDQLLQSPDQTRADSLQVGQSFVQVGFEHLQRERWHRLCVALLPQ